LIFYATIYKFLRLNPELYTQCKQDAIKLCKAPEHWHDWSTKAEGENVIMPCLFHHVHDDEDSSEDKDDKVFTPFKFL
jgi:hypothetical protein